MNLPESAHAAGSPLRPYQKRAVQHLAALLAKPGSRACLVAPPGAGKTRCALHIAAELGGPVEVFVPTTSLRDQWLARARESLIAADGSAPPLQVHTYAANPTVAAGALIVLDEAHHVTAAWGRKIATQLDDSHRVLGLTGTPPLDATGWDLFVQLVGDDPVEISAPPLVRDGHLAPYQELVWPVLAQPHEVAELAQADRVLAAVEARLEPQLSVWVQAQLVEDLEALTEARFARQEGLLVALCRRQHHMRRPLPADLPRDPEFMAPPSLGDRALLLWSFGRDRQREDEVKAALDECGFRSGRTGPVMREDIAWRSLSACGARLAGCIDVLALEHRARADGVRALVLTDRDREGGRLAARAVLKALVADPRTDALDPILVTGSVFWVDDDLWPRIQHHLPALPWVEAADHHELDVSAWPTAQRVALATQLLSTGATRCLVGTRHLLGEGWDCPAVNVAIDLTGIVASVTVNQVRGRAMRRDPVDPSKVASLWEVPTLAPGLPGGDRMLRRLQDRHEHTLGIDREGRIRAGAARIDPLLARPLVEVLPNLATLRQHMTARALDQPRVAALWAVGRPYHDRRLWRVTSDIPEPIAVKRAVPPRKELAPAGPQAVVRRRSRLRRGQAVIVAGGVGLGMIGAVLLAPLTGIFAGAAAVLGMFAGGGAAAGLGRLLRSRVDRDAAILHALWSALATLDDDLGPLRLRDGKAWVDGPVDQSRRYAQAAAELLGPVRYPRYLLVEAGGRTWPVPDALGASRQTADALAHAWSEEVGACAVLFARQGKGRDLLKAAWQAGEHRQVEVVEDWE